MPLDSRLAQASRTLLAEPLLDAPALATPLLDTVRRRPSDVNAWAEVPYEALSGGEQIVFGWLAAQVWPDRPGLRSSWSLWHVVDWCIRSGDDETLAAVGQVADDLHEVMRSEMGVAA